MTQKELEDLIIKYQTAYYDGNELVDDATYDKLYDELEQKYPDSYLLKKVGEDTIKGKKIKQSDPCMDQETREEFHNENEDLISNQILGNQEENLKPIIFNQEEPNKIKEKAWVFQII